MANQATMEARIITQSSVNVPLRRRPIALRGATLADLPWIDALYK